MPDVNPQAGFAHDPDAILDACREHIAAGCPGDLLPGHYGAVNLSGLLATLEKYGPGIVANLAPLAGGFSAPAVISAVIGIVQVIQSGGSPPPQ